MRDLLRRLHLGMAGVWLLLAIPTLLWWKDSVTWVALLSLYANFASEVSAHQAGRAERAASNDGEA